MNRSLVATVTVALILTNALTCSIHAGTQRRIALTFDDAPRSDGGIFTGVERTARLIAELEKAGVEEAMFFVTTTNIESESDRERLRDYVRAGHVLANHSHSHRWLSRTETDEYIADVVQAQRILAEFEGYEPFYRFPFLDEGRTEEKRDALRTALAEIGLANGYVTVDNYDWHLAGRTASAAREGQAIDRDKLREVYLEHLLQSVEHYDSIARETLGRSPKHVLLLHENDLAALFVGDLVRALREDGWEIIPAREAYDDPIASEVPATLFNNQGRVAALAHLDGMSPRAIVQQSEDEAVLDELLEKAGVFD